MLRNLQNLQNEKASVWKCGSQKQHIHSLSSGWRQNDYNGHPGCLRSHAEETTDGPSRAAAPLPNFPLLPLGGMWHVASRYCCLHPQATDTHATCSHDMLINMFRFLASVKQKSGKCFVLPGNISCHHLKNCLRVAVKNSGTHRTVLHRSFACQHTCRYT